MTCGRAETEKSGGQSGGMIMREDRAGRQEKLQKIFMIVFAGALAVVVAVCSASFGQERRVPVYSVDTGEKKVAISFDAAWGDEFTGGILDILDTYNVKATFFLVDFWSQKYPDDVKEIAKRGHDIGNHSASHPDMADLTEAEIAQELNTCADTIESLTGRRPTLFRPPYGSYSDTLITTAESLGYQTIQWSVDTCAAEEKAQDMFFGNFLSVCFPVDIETPLSDFDPSDQKLCRLPLLMRCHIC